jgi:pimeloyl-ACP methyl ester carboxylesterase
MSDAVPSRRARRGRMRLAEPELETVVLAMSSGPKLAVEIRRPRGPAVGTAILLHSMMASRRVWNRPRERGFASELNDAGLRTLALDFRGHGESRPGAGRGSAFHYDEWVNEDIPAICAAARERWPGQRVTLIGHSLGGSAAMASVATQACAPDALVALATNVWMPSDEPNPLLRAKKAAIVHACRAISRAAGYFPARALGVGSDDEALPSCKVGATGGSATAGAAATGASTTGPRWLGSRFRFSAFHRPAIASCARQPALRAFSSGFARPNRASSSCGVPMMAGPRPTISSS